MARGVVCVVVLAALGGLVWESLVIVRLGKTRLDVVEFVIALEDLPVHLNNTRVVQVSDLHVDMAACELPGSPCKATYVTVDFLREVFGRVNELEADVVVLTGDFVVHQKEAVQRLVPLLRELQAPHRLAVLGNHDHIEWKAGRFIAAHLERGGIRVLENEAAFPLGPGLAFVGTDDPWAGYGGGVGFRPQRAFQRVPPSVPRVVLSHQPDSFEQLRAFRADLVLSGHTHGGQLPAMNTLFPWYGALLDRLSATTREQLPFQDFAARSVNLGWMAGMFEAARTAGDGVNRMYVNRGIGSNFGARLGCNPEITVFDLVS